jgi:hypothetical protein
VSSATKPAGILRNFLTGELCHEARRRRMVARDASTLQDVRVGGYVAVSGASGSSSAFPYCSSTPGTRRRPGRSGQPAIWGSFGDGARDDGARDDVGQGAEAPTSAPMVAGDGARDDGARDDGGRGADEHAQGRRRPGWAASAR